MCSILLLLTINFLASFSECSQLFISDWYAHGNSKYFDNFTASVVREEDGSYNFSGSAFLNEDFVRGYVN